MRKTIYIIVACVLFICDCISAQTKPVVSLPYIRESDVVWSKEVWRSIDLADRYNFPFYFPVQKTKNKLSLFDVILKATLSGELKVYKTDDVTDTFSLQQISNKIAFHDSVLFYYADEFGNDSTKKHLVIDTMNGEFIAQYYIRETWFFDRQRSVMDVRIRAICPVKYDVDKDLLIPLFWINYNEARPFLNAYNAINSKNESEERTFDELFIKRKFTSTIRKEGNIFDREIADYVNSDKEALTESERIKELLRNFECDLWQW
ncbi:MAG TPA: gliding motility protein GldN [Bacteroidia bacterium]